MMTIPKDLRPPNGSEATSSREENSAKAKRLRGKGCDGGLRFSSYLPPSLADWLLGLVEQGTFTDPSEAVFVMLGEMRELAAHPDLRTELLKRGLIAAAEDPRPGIPIEEVEARLRRWAKEPRPEPALWDGA